MDQAQSALSSRRPDESVPENFCENMSGNCDFSKEEYLELNDFYSPETSSASSDNSSRMSVNSDEYFDPDALLRDIENDHGLGVEEEYTECRFSISAPVKSSQHETDPFNMCVLEREVRAERAPMEMAQVKGGNGHHSRPRMTRAVSWLPSRSVSEWRGCALNRLRSKHAPLPFRSSRLGVPRPASFRHIHILFNSSIAVDAILFPLFLFILPR
ncbi:hypothetical protein GW17_00013579 [Ensete ventricosum]|nr:hypothetical protein GW17_00013579 [Ensete ventricosum]RZR78957.1 hypothetical protein BHM03_00004519 [Ensete ventricosum]